MYVSYSMQTTVTSLGCTAFQRHRAEPLAFRAVNQQLYINTVLRKADEILIAELGVEFLRHYLRVGQTDAKADDRAYVAEHRASRFRLELVKVLVRDKRLRAIFEYHELPNTIVAFSRL